MVFSKDSVFYIKGKKMLDDFVARGGNVEDLSIKDKEYKYIKDSKVYDEHGNPIGLEDKFALLGHKRENKRSNNIRQDLIKEIQDYINNGGDLHIERKKLPFFERLHTFSVALKREGKILTHEQIMKNELGFKQYSDVYYRCKGLELLNQYQDENGYVDSYHKNNRMSSYVTDLAISLKVPYYIVITLLADAKLEFYDLSLDKIKYIERRLQNYATKYKSFVGIKRKDPKLYNDFEYLTRYYSDGTSGRFSKADWLFIFGLRDVEHRFRELKQVDIDIDEIMFDLKNKYQDQTIIIKDIDNDSYRKIVKKAVSLGVEVSEIFGMHGLKCNGIRMPRLSQVRLEELPYLNEMKQRMKEIVSEIIDKRKQNQETDLSKEEMLEAKVESVQQVYSEFKEKLENYLPEIDDIYSAGDSATNNI